jgi:peptidoglycan/LPS O-acetylase OafA/YrhL
MRTTAPIRHFPCLDEMRFLAAAAIVLMHTEELKFLHHFKNFYQTISNWSIAVSFFFVLSGFLITYLLLAEHQSSGTIHIRRFYVRRALRIWPLYFLVVLVGLLIIPHLPGLAIPGVSEFTWQNWWPKFVLFVTFLPNLAFVLYRIVPYAAQAWSIGTEEQFYLSWPIFLKATRRRLPGMFAVVLLSVLARIGAEYVWKNDLLLGLCNVMQIGSLALGGIIAHLLFHNRTKSLAILFNPITQVLALGLLIALIAARVTIPFVHFEIYAALFGCIVINAAGNPRALFRPRSRWLAALGRRSYGIYMYHPWLIGTNIWLLHRYFGMDLGRVGPTLLLHFLTLTFTFALSFISYRYFETPFLKLKDRFAVKTEEVPLRGHTRPTVSVA